MLTEGQIETRLTEGRARPKLDSVATGAGGVTRTGGRYCEDAVRAAAGSAMTKTGRFPTCWRRAESIKQEAADLHDEFVKAAAGAHAVGNHFSIFLIWRGTVQRPGGRCRAASFNRHARNPTGVGGGVAFTDPEPTS